MTPRASDISNAGSQGRLPHTVRSMVGLLGLVVLVTIGERLGERFLPIYLTALGGGTLAIGLLAGLKNLLGALYSLPGGAIAHALGYKRALLLFNAIAIAGYALVVLASSWILVIVGAALFLSWSAISLPATMDLVGKAVPKDRRALGVSLHSLVRRFPMALGPVIGGLLIDRYGDELGVRIGFTAAILLALVAMLIQQWLIADDRKVAAVGLRGGGWAADLPRPLRELLISDVLIRFCEQIPDTFVILWCMDKIANPVSAGQFGILTAVEMATAAACYLPVAYYADRLGKRPFVLATFVFFTLFPLALMLSHSFWLLAAAFVVRGLKEFGEAARKALILDLAPDERKAISFGRYYFLRDSVVSLAGFGGAALWAISPQVNLLAAAAFGVAGTIWFALRGRDVVRTPAGC